MLLSLLRAAGASSADLRVLVVGETAMRRWNRDTFGKDRPTDVISFPEDDPATAVPGRVAGDVLLCPSLCLAGTAGWEGSPEERVFYYLVHALLHIQGHDHVGDPAAARRMRRRERSLYRAVTGRDPG
jgi:probable rRNA maturation factor